MTRDPINEEVQPLTESNQQLRYAQLGKPVSGTSPLSATPSSLLPSHNSSHSSVPVANFSTDTPNPNFGYGVMLLSAVCNCLLVVFIHLAEVRTGFPTVSSLIVRAVSSMILSCTYMFFNRDTISAVRLSRRSVLLLALRGLAGGPATLLSFIALARLPAGTAVTIFYASPALTAIASAIVLRDHPLTLQLICTIVVNFLGIALVSGPSVQGVQLDGVLCALCVAVMSTTVFVLQRAMGMRVHFILGVFAYSVGCTLMALVTARENDFYQVLHNWEGLFFALCSGIAGFGSQCFLNMGLRHAPAGPAIVVRSLNVPLTFLLGLVFLGERPSWSSLVGVMVVLVSVASIGFQKVRQRSVERTNITPGNYHEVAIPDKDTRYYTEPIKGGKMYDTSCIVNNENNLLLAGNTNPIKIYEMK